MKSFRDRIEQGAKRNERVIERPSVLFRTFVSNISDLGLIRSYGVTPLEAGLSPTPSEQCS